MVAAQLFFREHRRFAIIFVCTCLLLISTAPSEAPSENKVIVMVEAPEATATTATIHSKTILTFDNLNWFQKAGNQFPRNNNNYGGVEQGKHLKISKAISWKQTVPKKTTAVGYHWGSIDPQNFFRLHLNGGRQYTLDGASIIPYLDQFKSYRGNPPGHLNLKHNYAYITMIVTGDLEILSMEVGTRSSDAFEADSIVFGTVHTPGTGKVVLATTMFSMPVVVPRNLR